VTVLVTDEAGNPIPGAALGVGVGSPLAVS
jgi:hypothetical protein